MAIESKDKILIAIISLIFILSGGAKLTALDFEMVAFQRWGYPVWFMYLTGALEVLGGLAVAIGILRKFAAAGLALLMIGAIATHLMHAEWPMLILATLIFGLTLFLSLKLFGIFKRVNDSH